MTERERMSDELDALKAEVREKDERIEKLQQQRNEMAAWKPTPDDPCSHCGGWGRRAYGDTSTWRRGIGGQAITEDVCDRCWGSGTTQRQGVNIRLLEAEVVRLRTAIVQECRERCKGREAYNGKLRHESNCLAYDLDIENNGGSK